MIYFAHRGASSKAPANSVAAFKLARQQGATHYELDVHATQDGHLVVQHDYTVGRGPHRVSEFTYGQLQSFCAKNGLACPALLEEILPIVRPEIKLLNIEIKNDDNVYSGIEEILLRHLQQHAAQWMDNILISSFDFPTLRRLRALDPDIKIGLLTRAFDPQFPCELHAYSVHINHTRLTAPIVQACHAENQKVFVYTVNDPALAQQLANLGVDGIFTDDITIF